jgi:hypothetical protein
MKTGDPISPPGGYKDGGTQMLRMPNGWKIRARKLTIIANEGNIDLFELARRQLAEAEGRSTRRPRVSTAPPLAGEIKDDTGALFRTRNLERSEHVGVGPNPNIKRGHAVLSKSYIGMGDGERAMDYLEQA